MAKIERLTEAQAARLPVFRDEYLAHGTNTAPADRPRAEAAFARAYQAIGKQPVPVIWVNSPLSASIAFAALEPLALLESTAPTGAELLDQLWDQLMGQLWDQLGSQLGSQLWRQLLDQLGGQLRHQLLDQLGGQLRSQLLDQLWNQLESQLVGQLWDQLERQLGGQLGSQLRDQLWDQLGETLKNKKISAQQTYWWGQQDLYWIAFYKFCAEIGVKFEASTADTLDIMHEIGLSCMWWYPRDGLIIACERPLAVHFDERGRLHNDAGAAVEFRDGWKIYAVHGVGMPDWVFEEPAHLTIDAIHAEPNSEIQRVMVERFGWDRYSAECGAEIVDHDERWGTLCRRKSASGDPILFLRVVNRSPEPDGSFRNYVLPVDSQLRPIPDPAKADDDFGEPQKLTALNAVASTFGLRGKEYCELLSAES